MYKNVAPYAKEFITITPANPRAMSAEGLADYLRQFGKPVTACDVVEDGVRLAHRARRRKRRGAVLWLTLHDRRH